MTPDVAVNPWAFHAHLEVWALVAGIGGAYVVALRRLGPRLAEPGDRAPARRVTAFAAGLVLLLAMAGWPVHDLAEDYLFSVHMLQHTLLSLAVPALLLLGLPEWLLAWLTRGTAVRAVLNRLGRPLVAGLMFNAVVAFSHWPAWVDATLRSEPLHFGAHALLFGTAALMWFPVVNRLPGLPSMSYPVRMIYLFLQSVIPTVPASFLTFASAPVYRFYETVPRPFPLSVVDDQQLAGAVMKLGGGLILWGTIIVLFFRWYSSEQRDQPKPGVLRWEDVERELERTPAAPEPSPPSTRA